MTDTTNNTMDVIDFKVVHYISEHTKYPIVFNLNLDELRTIKLRLTLKKILDL